MKEKDCWTDGYLVYLFYLDWLGKRKATHEITAKRWTDQLVEWEMGWR
jgi:hypothetical protein